MLRQLIFGGAVSLVNIAVHAATMMVIIRSRGAIHANVPTHPALRLQPSWLPLGEPTPTSPVARSRINPACIRWLVSLQVAIS